MVGRNNLYNAVKHFESSVCLLCAVGYTDKSGVCNEMEMVIEELCFWAGRLRVLVNVLGCT